MHCLGKVLLEKDGQLLGLEVLLVKEPVCLVYDK
jgi:hypothetical protein